MNSPVAVGDRVRCKKLFPGWKQTPGTVLEVDRYFQIAHVQFDNHVTEWVSFIVLERGQAAAA